jgi:hypothetical protein
LDKKFERIALKASVTALLRVGNGIEAGNAPNEVRIHAARSLRSRRIILS